MHASCDMCLRNAGASSPYPVCEKCAETSCIRNTFSFRKGATVLSDRACQLGPTQNFVRHWVLTLSRFVRVFLCARGHATLLCAAHPSECPPPVTWHFSSLCGQEQMENRSSSRGRPGAGRPRGAPKRGWSLSWMAFHKK